MKLSRENVRKFGLLRRIWWLVEFQVLLVTINKTVMLSMGINIMKSSLIIVAETYVHKRIEFRLSKSVARIHLNFTRSGIRNRKIQWEKQPTSSKNWNILNSCCRK